MKIPVSCIRWKVCADRLPVWCMTVLCMSVTARGEILLLAVTGPHQGSQSIRVIDSEALEQDLYSFPPVFPETDEELMAIVRRPSTGEFYVISRIPSALDYYLSKLDMATGIVNHLGGEAFLRVDAGRWIGADFNPATDQLRVVASNHNLLLDPDTAEVISSDDSLNASEEIRGLAFPIPSAPFIAGDQRPYVIGTDKSQLYRLGPSAVVLAPGGGSDASRESDLTLIGSLGEAAVGGVAFDISPVSRTAYAAMSALNKVMGGIRSEDGLYQIDLGSGAASLIGPLPPVNAPPPKVALGIKELAVAVPPRISVSNASVTPAESGSPNLKFMVSLSHPMVVEVTVDYETHDRTARAGADYTAASGTLRFAIGETSSTVPVEVNTSVNAADKTMEFNLDSAAHATIIDGQGIGTILQNAADSDGDGVADVADKCPEVMDPMQLDSDGDGFGNACDNCVQNANADQLDSDGDSFGDTCDNCPMVANPDLSDKDDDGTGDACDQCPADAGKIEPGACGCGVPDVDTDGDGEPDCLESRNAPTSPPCGSMPGVLLPMMLCGLLPLRRMRRRGPASERGRVRRW